MVDQTATAVYDPNETDPSKLIDSFATAKESGESRFTLASLAGDAPADGGSGTADTSNDFAPPLPTGSPDFGGSDAAPPEPSGGDFDVSLEAPAE